MIKRSELGGDEKRFCRHEKIRDFLLLPAFMDEHHERRRQHAADEPFWGVYERLATALPDEEEKQLRDFLVQRAGDTESGGLLERYTWGHGRFLLNALPPLMRNRARGLRERRRGRCRCHLAATSLPLNTRRHDSGSAWASGQHRRQQR